MSAPTILRARLSADGQNERLCLLLVFAANG